MSKLLKIVPIIRPEDFKLAFNLTYCYVDSFSKIDIEKEILKIIIYFII